jgi:hypothetical protein
MDRLGEEEKCKQVREIVLSRIDWECEVKYLFRDENLGCGRAPADAITWFFDQEKEGIILEDDTLPNQSFFVFCQEMLSKFRDNPGIMHISGNNFQLSWIGNESYYLSKLPHSWGWATWKRAWKKFDFELKDFNVEEVEKYFDFPKIDNYWHNMFKLTKQELHHHVWDYQWVFANLKNNGLSVLPQKNLVSNIGFGQDSTHTSNAGHFFSNLKSYEMISEGRDTIPIYDPIADINFHILFGWQIEEPSPANIFADRTLKTLFAKLWRKIFIKK